MFWGQIIGNDRNCRDEKSTFSKLVLTLKFFKFFLWKSRPSLNCWLSDDYFTCTLSFWLLRPICLWICKIWWKSLTSMYGNIKDYLSLKGNLEFATPWITLPSSHPLWLPPPIVWWRLWKIIGWQVEFNIFLHTNEHTERMCWYLLRQVGAEPPKIKHFQFSKWIFMP